MLKTFVLLTIPLLLPAAGVAQASGDSLLLQCGFSAPSTSCIYKVSIIQLLARPEVFDGKRVQVEGYIHLEFEGQGIYLHQEDEQRSLYRNGLWVEFQTDSTYKTPCQDRYVLIEGTFRARHHGHMGLWGGAITSITRCMPWG